MKYHVKYRPIRAADIIEDVVEAPDKKLAVVIFCEKHAKTPELAAHIAKEFPAYFTVTEEKP